jgi:hypothetical protein
MAALICERFIPFPPFFRVAAFVVAVVHARRSSIAAAVVGRLAAAPPHLFFSLGLRA